jgi:hypothetical protein
MSSTENEMMRSQQKFQKEFYRVIREIYSTFNINNNVYVRNGFSVDKIKNEYDKIKNIVTTEKTKIRISRDDIYFIRQYLTTIHTCCILNIIEFNDDLVFEDKDTCYSNFWKTQCNGYKEALKKNHDYGDSFREHGFMGVLVRLSDKVKRLIHISNSKKFNFETQEDTFKDLANYCVMGVFLLDENEDIHNRLFKSKNKFQWTCNYCASNEHHLYSNKKDKDGEIFKVLTCPVLKDTQFYSFCNYCKEYGHRIYYRFGHKYKSDNDKILYTCPKLITKKLEIINSFYDKHAWNGNPDKCHDHYVCGNCSKLNICNSCEGLYKVGCTKQEKKYYCNCKRVWKEEHDNVRSNGWDCG